MLSFSPFLLHFFLYFLQINRRSINFHLLARPPLACRFIVPFPGCLPELECARKSLKQKHKKITLRWFFFLSHFFFILGSKGWQQYYCHNFLMTFFSHFFPPPPESWDVVVVPKECKTVPPSPPPTTPEEQVTQSF